MSLGDDLLGGLLGNLLGALLGGGLLDLLGGGLLGDLLGSGDFLGDVLCYRRGKYLKDDRWSFAADILESGNQAAQLTQLSLCKLVTYYPSCFMVVRRP